MAKRPTQKTITSGFSSANMLNYNVNEMLTAFDNTLSLDGSAPNAMAADFDMNSNDILNVGDITAANVTITGTLTGAGAVGLTATNNLSDVDSATTSATNLGLGTGDSPQFADVLIGDVSRSYYLPGFSSNYAPGIQGSGASYESAAWLSLAQWSTSTSTSGGANLSLNKSNGVAGTHTIVNSSQRIGSIGFAGSDGAKFVGVADIIATTDGAPALNNVPGKLGFYTTGTGAAPEERLRIDSTGIVHPGADNAQTIGKASRRWSVVYAGTGTINTSDEREKQQITALDDAERRVAVAIKGLVKKYKFNDAVATKGPDARIHVGVIAQEVVTAFAAEGLDATRYALLCFDTWEAEPEELDEEGNVITPGREAGERYGIRYEELLTFMIAAL